MYVCSFIAFYTNSCLNSENDELTRMSFTTDGFFDAGVLLQALKASHEDDDHPSQNVGHARRAVGKKLRLGEY